MINTNTERKAANLIEALTRTCEELLEISEKINHAEETHEVSWDELDSAMQRYHRLTVLKCAMTALKDITWGVTLIGDTLDTATLDDADFIF